MAAENEGRHPDLPEGFNSVADLAKSFTEQKSLMGRQSTELGEMRQRMQQAPQAQQPTPQQQQGLGVHSPNPQQMSAVEYIGQFAQEYNSTGKLSDATYHRIQSEKGWDRPLVDNYIQGQLAMGREVANAGYQAVGGKENYQSMATWMQNNLPPHEIEAYNGMVESGNPFMAQMAVSGMWNRYQQSEGGGMSLMSGNGSVGASMNPAEGYQDEQTWMNAMMDNKYETDPEYRRTVIRKLANSPWAFQNPRHRVIDKDTFLDGALKGLSLG